jgi:hypothetical protein
MQPETRWKYWAGPARTLAVAISTSGAGAAHPGDRTHGPSKIEYSARLARLPGAAQVRGLSTSTAADRRKVFFIRSCWARTLTRATPAYRNGWALRG